uniref:Uncharacterized protein n=1 Tax=Anguilla anguilla TaxID=7936 RepID=A0A0E9T586_ANGAN
MSLIPSLPPGAATAAAKSAAHSLQLTPTASLEIIHSLKHR